MPFDDSDRGLVDRVKAGDPTAFSSLHRRYYARLYRFAYLRTGNADDATDIASETFCRALQRIGQLRVPAKRLTLSLAAPDRQQPGHRPVPRAARRRRSLARRAVGARPGVVPELPARREPVGARDPGTERGAGVRGGGDRQLPADQARAVVFRFLADLSIRDIAREMDRSEGAIKSLLHRALQGLRDRLREGAEAAQSAGTCQKTGRAASQHGRETIRDPSTRRAIRKRGWSTCWKGTRASARKLASLLRVASMARAAMNRIEVPARRRGGVAPARARGTGRGPGQAALPQRASWLTRFGSTMRFVFTLGRRR